MTESICPFCEIAAHRLQSSIVYEDQKIIAFKDILPKAPVHLLIIPKIHLPSVNEVENEHAETIGLLFLVARKLAAEFNLTSSGYRLIINTGSDAGQTVQHLHIHLLGGRRLPFQTE